MDEIAGILWRHAGLAHYLRQCFIGGVAGRLPGDGHFGQPLDFGEAFGGRAGIVVAAVPQHLAVDDIIGVATPGVEQHRAVARDGIEELRRHGEAFRAARDGSAGVAEDVGHASLSPRREGANTCFGRGRPGRSLSGVRGSACRNQ